MPEGSARRGRAARQRFALPRGALWDGPPANRAKKAEPGAPQGTARFGVSAYESFLTKTGCRNRRPLRRLLAERGSGSTQMKNGKFCRKACRCEFLPPPCPNFWAFFFFLPRRAAAQWLLLYQKARRALSAASSGGGAGGRSKGPPAAPRRRRKWQT